jgi:hypothetical protein
MQDRPVLGDVDFVATKHGFNARTKTALPCQLAEELDRFIGYPILRVVEVQASSFEREALASFWIIREQRSEMHVADSLVMSSKRLPCLSLS